MALSVPTGNPQASMPQSPAQQPQTRPSNGTVPFGVSPDNDMNPYFSESARQKRNQERQKRLEGDADRLLSLANQLKSEVAASGAESMTPDMLRQMDEIEKLAKSVKEKMRN